MFPLATPVALSRCATCGLVFQQTPALVEFAQAESCYAERNLAHRRELRPELLAQARRRLQWLRRYVSAGARVLEVGGATGEFAFEATRLGWHVTLHDQKVRVTKIEAPKLTGSSAVLAAGLVGA